MQPLISVIITSHNNCREITRAITSVKSQTYPCIELIIIDDCSTDNSVEIISKYHPDKLIINPLNVGPYQSRITALKSATGDYVTFLDADDWLDHHAIEKCVFSAILLKAEIVQMRIKRRVTAINLPFKYNSKYSPNDALNACLYDERLFPVGCCGKLYRKSFLETIKFPRINTRWGEDRIFNLAVFIKKRITTVDNQAVYNYKWGGGSTKINLNTINQYYSVYRYKIKWAEINAHHDKTDKIKNEFIVLLNYWMRQIISTGIYSKEEIINQISTTISSTEFDGYNLTDIYNQNNKPLKRYFSKIIRPLV